VNSSIWSNIFYTEPTTIPVTILFVFGKWIGTLAVWIWLIIANIQSYMWKWDGVSMWSVGREEKRVYSFYGRKLKDHVEDLELDGSKKGKGKVRPRTDHEGSEGQKYSLTLSLTPTLDGVGGQRHVPAALPPGKRLCGPQGISGRMRSVSPSTGIRYPDRPACSKSSHRLSYFGPN
jgi:hypothetical protein